jgi:hypothetical protein
VWASSSRSRRRPRATSRTLRTLPAHVLLPTGAARDAAPARLLSCGVARALSLLIPKYPGAAGEQLRVLGLVAAGCSGDVARYVLAVPAFGAWLGGHADTRAGGGAEAHGALWRLLAMSTTTSAAGSAATATTSNGSSNGSSVEPGPGALLALLRETKDLRRLHAALALMQVGARNGVRAWHTFVLCSCLPPNTRKPTLCPPPCLFRTCRRSTVRRAAASRGALT